MKRALIVLLLLSPLGLGATLASAAVDPFYRNRMESGVRAYERGDWQEAAHQLRIACFGYLDEPKALVDGLLRLAVVEVELGNEDGFRRIFSRLVDLEERFSAYSGSTAPEALRRKFERQAARLIPIQNLRSNPGFAAIAERWDVERLADLPVPQRRAELEAKIQAEPDRADWLVEMARLELATGRPRLALDWLDRMPEPEGTLPPASCLRQQAASESGACDRMDLAQPFCQNAPDPVIEGRLQCLVDAERWPEAAALLAGLSPETRARRRIARLQRRVRNHVDESTVVPEAAVETSVTVPAGAESSTTSVAAPTQPAPEPPAPSVDPTELDGMRKRLAAAATAGELSALRAEAEALAERHPASRAARLLAAEIAYLASDWPAAVTHFARAGELGPEEVQLAFYRAVALFESGDAAAAAEVLRPVAERLERSTFVDSYLDRILSPGI